MKDEKKPERGDRIDALAFKLKGTHPDIADKILKIISAELIKLEQLKIKSDKLMRGAIEAETKKHYINAASEYWEACAIVHGQYENSYNEAKILMAVGRCLFNLRMQLLSIVYFEKAKALFIEEKAKDRIMATELNEVISICDEYIEQVDELYPFISKEIIRIQQNEEYVNMTSSFVNFSRKSLSFFNYAIFLSGKLVLKNIPDIPSNEVAAVYEEASRAYLATRGSYPLATKLAKDALMRFEELNDDSAIRRVNLLLEEIKIKRKEYEG